MHPFRPLSQVTGAAEVSATHEVLMDDLAQILDSEDGAESATLLARIQAQMPWHFQLEEERDGVFDWILMLAPNQSAEVESLIADHALLLEECAALRPPVRGDNHRDLAATLQLEAFAEHMRQHERRESAALQLALEIAEGS